MSLEKKILDKIENGKVSIRPKWFFMFLETVYFLAALAFFLLGSFSLGMLFFIMHSAKKEMSFTFFPYFWAVLVSIFSYFGIRIFSGVGSVYKLRYAYVSLIFMFSSAAFGYASFYSGASAEAQKNLAQSKVYQAAVPASSVLESNEENEVGKEKRLIKNDSKLEKENDGEKSNNDENYKGAKERVVSEDNDQDQESSSNFIKRYFENRKRMIEKENEKRDNNDVKNEGEVKGDYSSREENSKEMEKRNQQRER